MVPRTTRSTCLRSGMVVLGFLPRWAPSTRGADLGPGPGPGPGPSLGPSPSHTLASASANTSKSTSTVMNIVTATATVMGAVQRSTPTGMGMGIVCRLSGRRTRWRSPARMRGCTTRILGVGRTRPSTRVRSDMVGMLCRGRGMHTDHRRMGRDRDRDLTVGMQVIPTSTSTRRMTRRGMGMDKDRGTMRTSSSSRDMGMHPVRGFLFARSRCVWADVERQIPRRDTTRPIHLGPRLTPVAPAPAPAEVEVDGAGYREASRRRCKRWKVSRGHRRACSWKRRSRRSVGAVFF
jgi:hypothetical protein